jgi:hypothetical protein
MPAPPATTSTIKDTAAAPDALAIVGAANATLTANAGDFTFA